MAVETPGKPGTPAKPDTSDDGWTEVATSVTRVIFEAPGDSFTAEYVTEEQLNGTDGPFTQWVFKKDGELYGIFGSYAIDKGMDQVPEGALTKITFTGEKDVGRPSPMREFKIQYKPL